MLGNEIQEDMVSHMCVRHGCVEQKKPQTGHLLPHDDVGGAKKDPASRPFRLALPSRKIGEGSLLKKSPSEKQQSRPRLISDPRM